MFHIDRSNKIIYCVNTWDCTAPGIHYDTREEAQEDLEQDFKRVRDLLGS